MTLTYFKKVEKSVIEKPCFYMNLNAIVRAITAQLGGQEGKIHHVHTEN